MDILVRCLLVAISAPMALLFLGTALTWFAWVISRSDNGW
jgi:hypothetical protein